MNHFNIFPEFFVYPWLVSHGLLPYRDFFDHHGFIAYYLLVPFVFDKTLHLLTLFFVVLQLFNFTIVLSLLRKSRSILLTIFGSIGYILLTIYASDNMFWFEHLITSFL